MTSANYTERSLNSIDQFEKLQDDYSIGRNYWRKKMQLNFNIIKAIIILTFIKCSSSSASEFAFFIPCFVLGASKSLRELFTFCPTDS